MTTTATLESLVEAAYQLRKLGNTDDAARLDELRVKLVEAQPAAVAGEAVELDVTGHPKLPLSALEWLAVDACNRVKAWAESDRKAPLPEEAHALVDAVLLMAAQRRKGVQ